MVKARGVPVAFNEELPMKRYVPLAGLMAAMLGPAVFAQAPAPGAQPSDPSAASSPSQRSTVKSPAGESAATNHGANASDSATPHQKQVVKKKPKKKPAPPPSG
jgi:hypothetical protein